MNLQLVKGVQIFEQNNVFKAIDAIYFWSIFKIIYYWLKRCEFEKWVWLNI